MTEAGLRRPMTARAVDEAHRAATPLELFVDLCFVVGVAQASDKLHHALAEGHVGDGVPAFLMVFFAVWWAWMNFSWFASAYDNDDVPYRVATFVQVVGVLVLAAGVPRAFDDRDFAVVTLGYAVMRLGLVAQWLRAARDDPPRRATALRFAAGVTACMLGWGALLLVPEGARLPGFLAMVTAEVLVPVWAERPAPTTWHPEHIAERYGLFTLIVLGESVLATTFAVQAAVDESDEAGVLGDLAVTLAGAPLIVFCLWWVYFAKHAATMLVDNRAGFRWGYGHYVVFAAAAAVGAGLAVAADQATHHAEVSARVATAAVTVPAAVFLVTVWALHLPTRPPGQLGVAILPAGGVLVLLATFVPGGVLVAGLVLVAVVAAIVLTNPERVHPQRAGSDPTS